MKYENVIISPHIDDAFFSLGGLLIKCSSKPQKVVDVFSISDFTMRGRKGVKEVTAIRRKEEEKNAKEVGAKVDFLPFRDGSADGSKAYTEIYAAIKKYLKEGRRVFFPLGIGGHGDHVLLARIGIGLAKEEKGGNVYFYEDLPYAIKGTKLFSVMSGIVNTNGSKVFPVLNPRKSRGALEPEYISFSCARKIALCRTYESQTDWRILAAIRAHGRMLGNFVGCRERVWKVVDAEKLEVR